MSTRKSATSNFKIMEDLLRVQYECLISSCSLTRAWDTWISSTEGMNGKIPSENDPLLYRAGHDSITNKEARIKKSSSSDAAVPYSIKAKPEEKAKVAGKDEDYEDPDLENSIAKALALANQHGLIDFDNLPEPWRINRFILRGYRFTESKRDTALSLVCLSNETFNIWSHAVGMILIVIFAFFISPPASFRGAGGSVDVWVAGTYFSAAAACMLCSTVWHTAKSISDAKAMFSFVSVDMMGISLLLTASVVMTEYTAFYNDPFWKRMYMTLSIIGGIGGLVLPWTSLFRRHDLAYIKIDTSRIPITRAWIRVIYFTWLGVQGVIIPLFHLMWTQGVASTLEFYKPLLPVYAPIVIGAAIYAARFPEAWFPGRFDYVGGSHNLWHVAVLIGILRGCSAIGEMYNLAWERTGTSLAA
jgi:adiponectin receptor